MEFIIYGCIGVFFAIALIILMVDLDEKSAVVPAVPIIIFCVFFWPLLLGGGFSFAGCNDVVMDCEKDKTGDKP